MPPKCNPKPSTNCVLERHFSTTDDSWAKGGLTEWKVPKEGGKEGEGNSRGRTESQ